MLHSRKGKRKKEKKRKEKKKTTFLGRISLPNV
jgi:hypothetical protein